VQIAEKEPALLKAGTAVDSAAVPAAPFAIRHPLAVPQKVF